MKTMYLASAAFAALLAAAPVALAQNPANAPGGASRESPAASPPREKGAAETKSPGAENRASDNRASERGETRSSGAPGAERSAQEPHAGQPAQGNHGERSDKPSTAGAQEKTDKPDRADKADRDKTNAKGDASHEPGRAERNAPNQPGGSATGTAQTGQTGTSGNRASVSVGAGQQVNLDAKAQEHVRDFVARDRSARVDRVDFSLSVGTRVPEHVHYRPLPGELVSVFPQYRGYDYVIANDEIVIIEPRTREIVTIMAASGGEGRGRVPAHHARLSQKQERVVYTDAMRGARPITRSIEARVGERISADIDLMPLPQVVLRESPEIAGYRYFVVDREVVLVDPQTREIIDVIRE